VVGNYAAVFLVEQLAESNAYRLLQAKLPLD
jgi:hypothetical protein